MNMSNPTQGEFHNGFYKEYDRKKQQLKSKRRFKFKTYDDAQHREFKTQPLGATFVSKNSVSIETKADLPFKTGDVIEIDLFPELKYRITGVEYVMNVPQSFLNTIVSTSKSNLNKRIHLNKDDI